MTSPGEPDHYSLWMAAGGNFDVYRRLSVAATEGEPLPELPHEPGGPYCGVGGRPKPDHPHFRRCTCGRWYAWNGSVWRPGRPSKAWLEKHGLGGGLEDFMAYEPQEELRAGFGEFFLYGGWRTVLRAWLRR